MSKRKIRDTDIVYSAAARGGGVRFSLQPVLDSREILLLGPFRRQHGDLPARAVFSFGNSMIASCRSVGCFVGGIWDGPAARGPWVRVARDGSIEARHWSSKSDGWLNWLAEGEPDR